VTLFGLILVAESLLSRMTYGTVSWLYFLYKGALFHDLFHDLSRASSLSHQAWSWTVSSGFQTCSKLERQVKHISQAAC